jgi:methyltransferase family protein
MTDWQERITRQTPPAIRVEHYARYRLAARLVGESETWCDLGCGNGLAAAAGLEGARPGRAVLVDFDENAAAEAARQVGGEVTSLVADLTRPDDLDRVTSALLDGSRGPRVVTCFEVVEHLSTFVPLIEALTALEHDRGVDVVLSVPNDAFWAIQNPHHQTMWSEGAFQELRGLLPESAVVMHQVALAGSVVVPIDTEGAGRDEFEGSVVVDAAAAVPTHLLAAFGPRAARLAATISIAPVDLDGQRRWEREREAAASMVDALIATNAEQAQVIRSQIRRQMGSRAYVNDLERRLGLPLSGTVSQPPDASDREAVDAEHRA